MARTGRIVAGIVTVAALAGIGVGGYVGVPWALAGDRKPSVDRARAQPVTSSPSPTERPSAPETPPRSSSPTPRATTARPTTSPSPTGPCNRTGPGQLAVERYLAAHPQYGRVTVDGRQSAGDCAAIRRFQLRFGILPSVGYAGPVSRRVATHLAAAALGSCRPASGTTVCVDLTSQTMWVVRNGAVVLGPTTIRTGRAGLATPAGHYTIQDKKRRTNSTIFKVPLPYWQRFYADMGFHQTPSYLYEGDSPGSHGCINLLRRDAVAMFGLTRIGTPVHIFGRKAGT